jgi:hypothetical protein
MSQTAIIDMPLPVEETAATVPPVIAPASVLRRFVRATASGIDWVFGLLSLIVGLALFSIVPLLNFLSLGYLLHVSGQVAQTGKLRNGFVGIRKASILGSFIVGTWLIFLPLRFVSGMWKDAELVAPGSPNANAWHVGLLILTVLGVLHIVWACIRGGRLRHFLWPAPVRFFKWLRTPDKFETMRNTVVDYVVSLRLPYYFWLGARGFFGAFVCLFLPVATLIFAAQLAPDKGGVLFSFIGALMLMFVVLYLPFLQTHFAVTQRFRDLFAVKPIRQMFKRAPIAFWLAMLITLLFALPLYLLKIELPPREIAWLPSLLFVVFIFPARLLTGWAVSRAMRHEQPRHWFFRWTSRFALVPVVIFYVLFVYLTQYLSWNGSASLLEQHAFMVPAPLMGL